MSYQSTTKIVSYLALTLTTANVSAFQPAPALVSRVFRTRLDSSVGDGNGKPPSGGKGEGKGEWDEFLDPNRKEESENLQKAREFLSENSLPISFDEDSDTTTEQSEGSTDQPKPEEDVFVTSSALTGPSRGGELLPGSLSAEALAQNPYVSVVSKLTPSELISKFTTTAHPRVQNAVRTTILGLIGGLPKMAFDTTTVTTGQRLASLMFQLQMTGYMFKNAEYKLSMQQALGVDEEVGSQLRLKGQSQPTLSNDKEEDEEGMDLLKGKVRGKLRVSYKPPKSMDNNTDEGSKEKKKDDSAPDSVPGEIEVDAAAYMTELRSEVSKLRDELMITRKEKEETLRKDLLMYIRTLPEQELRSLTNTMSPDVLVAMKGLVGAVISGIGEGQIGPETVTEQSGEAMAQLCMWQLAIGYNLRTLEVREEMKKSLTADKNGAALNPDDEGGVDFSEPGALE